MAFGSEAKRCGVITLLLCSPLAAQMVEVKAGHGRLRWRAEGALRFDEDGLSFASEAKARRFQWRWAEIQSLELWRDRVVVAGYRDQGALRFHRDERQEFRFRETPEVERLYAFLAARMDSRLVARVALPPREVQWRVPAKRVRPGRGAQGELIVEAGRVLFVAQGTGESRVWRDADIDLISSSGPHQFTLTARAPGGDYEFQLKQVLDRDRYDALWMRLNRPLGLELLANQTKEK